MSKLKQIMAATLAMAAMAEQGGVFAPGLVREPSNPYEGETDEERRQRLHKMYGDGKQLHEFIIKGEAIMATDRKTALKIYANRHPDKKKKGRKR